VKLTPLGAAAISVDASVKLVVAIPETTPVAVTE